MLAPTGFQEVALPKLDLEAIPQSNRTGYPPPFDAPVAGRWWRRLAPAGGLTAMGASHVTLKPGGWSAQRHWHATEDELVVILAGEAVLIDDSGETVVRAGDCLAFPQGDRNGHHLVNRSEADCVYVAISAGEDSWGEYPDIDMKFTRGGYLHKDGTPYPTERMK
jgi:uncharacterized cupin superfamily protein